MREAASKKRPLSLFYICNNALFVLPGIDLAILLIPENFL